MSAYDSAITYRAALRQQNDAALVRLVNSYGRTYKRLETGVRALEADIMDALDRGEILSPDWLRRKARYQSLMKQTKAEMTKYSAVLESEIDDLAQSAIKAAGEDSYMLLSELLPEIPAASLKAVWNTLPTDAVETLMGFLADGSPLRDKLASYGTEAATRIAHAMEESLALGYSPRQLAKTFRKQAGMSLTDAMRTARTVQINTYREASRAAYAANPKIVPSWTWVSALDPPGTCMGCVAMHGTIHPVSEHLNDHHNGWCVSVPNPASYRDMGLDIDGPPLTDIPTGETYFKGLSPAEQIKFMPSKAAQRAWMDGKLQVSDFLGQHKDAVWGNMVNTKSLKDILGRDVAQKYYTGAKMPKSAAPAKTTYGRPPKGPDLAQQQMDEWFMDDLPGAPKGADWHWANVEQRGAAKHKLVSDLSKKTGAHYDDVNDFIKQWARTSNDDDMRSLAMQRDAAETLGTKVSKFTQAKTDKLEKELLRIATESFNATKGAKPGSYYYNWGLDQHIMVTKKAMPNLAPLLPSARQKALIDAMRELTREQFKTLGFGLDDTIRLRRGVNLPGKVTKNWKVGDIVPIEGNALESWSLAEDVAERFMYGEGNGVIFEMDVPVKMIVGSSRTGFGCLTEGEFVIQGLPSRAKIVKMVQHPID